MDFHIIFCDILDMITVDQIHICLIISRLAAKLKAYHRSITVNAQSAQVIYTAKPLLSSGPTVLSLWPVSQIPKFLSSAMLKIRAGAENFCCQAPSWFLNIIQMLLKRGEKPNILSSASIRSMPDALAEHFSLIWILRLLMRLPMNGWQAGASVLSVDFSEKSDSAAPALIFLSKKTEKSTLWK